MNLLRHTLLFTIEIAVWVGLVPALIVLARKDRP